jgi:hypothetical protein
MQMLIPDGEQFQFTAPRKCLCSGDGRPCPPMKMAGRDAGRHHADYFSAHGVSAGTSDRNSA